MLDDGFYSFSNFFYFSQSIKCLHIKFLLHILYCRLSLFFDFATTHAIGSNVIPLEHMKNETIKAYSQLDLNFQVSNDSDVGTVTITNVKGAVSARIIESDILLNEAIVHVIDNVLASPAEYPQVP